MDTGKIRDNQNAELSQLNQDYQRRKDKLIEQRDAEISQLKNLYTEKEENIRNNSEAVVSHLKIRTNEEIEQLKADSQKNLTNIKQTLLSEKQVYDKNLALLRNTNQQQIKKVDSDFEQQRQNRIENFHENYEQINKVQTKSLKDAQGKYQQQIRYLQNENQKEVTHAQNRGQTQLSKINDTYQDQIKKTQETGELKIKNEKLKNETLLNNLKSENKKNLEQEHESNNLQLEKERQTYRNQFDMTKETQEKELKHQNNQFRDTFQERQNQMSRNFSAQERVFDRELFKQKLNWTDKFKPFESQKEDPFYKLIDPKSEFNETDTAYILKTRIPSYDANSIHINVQKDKVSVQGNRTFKDEITDDQRKVASQQYQSFREEFQFSHPVVEKAIFQEREGDLVTVTIPKLQSSPKKSSRDLA